jgi:hypothetical protein
MNIKMYLEIKLLNNEAYKVTKPIDYIVFSGRL